MTLVAAYGVDLFTGPSISTELQIAAPAETVWNELTNGSNYSDDNERLR